MTLPGTPVRSSSFIGLFMDTLEAHLAPRPINLVLLILTQCQNDKTTQVSQAH